MCVCVILTDQMGIICFLLGVTEESVLLLFVALLDQ